MPRGEQVAPTEQKTQNLKPKIQHLLLPRVQIELLKARSVFQDEDVGVVLLVYLGRAGVLEGEADRVALLRARQLDARGQAVATLLAEARRGGVDHVGLELPALAVRLHARQAQRRDAVEPEAAQQARAPLPLRLQLAQDVVAAHDARARLGRRARVRLLLEALADGVDAVRVVGRGGRDEERFGQVVRAKAGERADGRALHGLLALLVAAGAVGRRASAVAVGVERLVDGAVQI